MRDRGQPQGLGCYLKEPLGGIQVGLPNAARENTGCSVKSELQKNIKHIFSISSLHVLFGTYLQ